MLSQSRDHSGYFLSFDAVLIALTNKGKGILGAREAQGLVRGLATKFPSFPL